jgi:transposase-like protein
VRSKSGREVTLPTVTRFQAEDPLPERVLNQIVLGVSTRGYGASLEPSPPGVRSRGTSKSAASRHLMERMGSKMRDYFSRPLGDVNLLALMIDGIEVARQTVVVALGIGEDGTKTPLGLWQGSTENRLRSLLSWLESNGHEDAAGSLREGMEETLTVLKLDLSSTLRRSLATTNAIETCLGTVRRVTRNVKRWRGGGMVRRWTPIGVLTAQKRFRRIKGHRDLHQLLAALRPKPSTEKVA